MVEWIERAPFPEKLRHIMEEHGFVMRIQLRYEMEYEFDLDSFIEFMMIQSNVNARIEGEDRSACEVRKWLRQSARPLFHEEKKAVIFTGYSCIGKGSQSKKEHVCNYEISHCNLRR